MYNYAKGANNVNYHSDMGLLPLSTIMSDMY